MATLHLRFPIGSCKEYLTTLFRCLISSLQILTYFIGTHVSQLRKKIACILCQKIICKFFFKMAQSRPILCLFLSCVRHNSNINWKKHRCWSSYSNPWPQDGWRRQIHWATYGGRPINCKSLCSTSFGKILHPSNVLFCCNTTQFLFGWIHKIPQRLTYVRNARLR